MPKAITHMVLRLLIVALATVGSLVCAACGPGVPGNTMHAKRAATTRNTMETGKIVETEKTTGPRLAWSAIKSWAYWLDNPDLTQLGASNFDLLVIDYSADGTALKAFSAEQIGQLRKNNAPRRVVAYLSIGQAESYRGYWKSGWHLGSPDWLVEPDAGWNGNYWVKYWNPEWQQMIYRYLDSIIAAGFDGVYLDRVDAYQETYASGHEDDMVQFVTEIARYARAHSPLGEDFGIIVQNAEELAADHPAYVQFVTGIGREEVYIQTTDRPTSQAERATTEGYLDRFLHNSRGRLVLTVDYATKPELICEAYQRARARGYVPYVTQVELNHLQNNPGCQ